MSEDHSNPSQGTILLVDDDPDFLLAFSNLFETSDYKVLLAYNGSQALKRALGEAPDVVFLDEIMPSLNGRQTRAALRTQGFTKPIILVTGKEQRPIPIRVQDSEHPDYMVGKPFDFDALLKLVSELVPPK